MYRMTSLHLFLVLLVVLVISVYFGREARKWTAAGSMEGYVGYNYSSAPLSMVAVTDYVSTRTVMKVYDNLYLDKVNANLVEVTGNTYVPSSNVAAYTAESITVYTPRDYASNQYAQAFGAEIPERIAHGPYTVSGTTNIPEKNISSIKEKYGIAVFQARSAAAWVFYIAHAENTYLHVVDISNALQKPLNAFSVAANSQEDTQQIRRYALGDSGTVVDTTKTAEAVDLSVASADDIKVEKNGLTDTIPCYDSEASPMYITNKFAYDTQNGSLIYIDSSSSIYVYQRQTSSSISSGQYTDNTPIHYTTNSSMSTGSSKPTRNNVPFYPRWFVTPDKKFYVYMVQVAYSTYGTLFRRNSQSLFTPFGVFSVVVDVAASETSRYYQTLLDRIDELERSNREIKTNFSPDLDELGEGTREDTLYGDSLSKYMSDYNYWSTYWNTAKDGSLNGFNYVPKTAIIPPICPTCPSCSGSGGGVCTSCGGQGGAGTQHRNRFSDFLSDVGTDVKQLATDTVSGTKDLLEDTGRGAAGLARDTASGTVNLAKDAAVGTVGLAKDAVTGTVGLAKETVGGTFGLARDLLGGLNPTQITNWGGSGMGPSAAPAGNYGYAATPYSSGVGSGVGNGIHMQQPTPTGTAPGTDPYSYYGRLPNRGSSNYIPVTADFSAFGK